MMETFRTLNELKHDMYSETKLNKNPQNKPRINKRIRSRWNKTKHQQRRDGSLIFGLLPHPDPAGCMKTFSVTSDTLTVKTSSGGSRIYVSILKADMQTPVLPLQACRASLPRCDECVRACRAAGEASINPQVLELHGFKSHLLLIHLHSSHEGA
ncbi:hypothetical protein CRENBAI_022945 [Crenichthys baileyi]|uniref:Uncharacterized protein n=1 Tax=Crenichthys baileyi TaxID=28760 RepID=A0AAV9S9K5_9TELE